MCKGVWGYPYKQYNLSTKDTLHLYCFQSPPTKGQPLSIKQSAKVSICVKPQHTHTLNYTLILYTEQTNKRSHQRTTHDTKEHGFCVVCSTAFYKIHAGTQYTPIQVCEPVRSFV